MIIGLLKRGYDKVSYIKIAFWILSRFVLTSSFLSKELKGIKTYDTH